MKFICIVLLFAVCISQGFANHIDYKPTESRRPIGGHRSPLNQPRDYHRYQRDVFDAEYAPEPETLPYPDYYEQDAVSHDRPRRQVYGNVEHMESGGSLVTAGAKGNLYKENGHSVDGNAQVSRHFHPNGPIQYGGGLKYEGPKAGASVDVNTARHMGTNVNAAGHVNILQSQDRRTRLDATGNYQQHFGPQSRPDFGGGLRFSHRF